MLLADGWSSVQMRVVAERSSVSLRTIYKYCPTREELILAAVERWMQENAYAGLPNAPTDGSIYRAVMWGLREIFEPRERHPQMLEAFLRARTAPGSDRLYELGLTAMGPGTERLVEDRGDAFTADFTMIHALVAFATIGMFVDGTLEVTQIVPMLERAVFRLVADETPATDL